MISFVVAFVDFKTWMKWLGVDFLMNLPFNSYKVWGHMFKFYEAKVVNDLQPFILQKQKI